MPNHHSNAPKIVMVHLLNDFSGSPRVLATVVEGFVKAGWEVDLWTSADTQGFLSKMEGVHFCPIPYTFYDNKFKRLFAFFWAQWTLFRMLQVYRKQDVVFYINTLMPFGAALAGKWLGKKVVYHLHEATVNPAPLRWLLRGAAAATADRGIFVSEYLQQHMGLKGVASTVVPNALPTDYWETATVEKIHEFSLSTPNHIATAVTNATEKIHEFSLPAPDHIATKEPIALMLCSLKAYKGVWELVDLARRLPVFKFQLVLNADMPDIKAFFGDTLLPDNLMIFSKQSNVHVFYERALVVLNLSRPDGWIESFGMSLLEAMAHGVPVIAPEIGGPPEFVRHGWNGYCISAYRTDDLVAALLRLHHDPQHAAELGYNARLTAAEYGPAKMQNSIIQTVKMA